MANRRRDDDLFVDDELTAAFLDDEIPPAGWQLKSLPMMTTKPTATGSILAKDEIDGQLPVDIYETKQHLVVKCRLPGVDRDQLEVGLVDNTLTIRGAHRPIKVEHEIENHLVQECYWGEFTRSIGLPLPVKEEGIKAVLSEGVLTITFIKIKQDIVKKIDIE